MVYRWRSDQITSHPSEVGGSQLCGVILPLSVEKIKRPTEFLAENGRAGRAANERTTTRNGAARLELTVLRQSRLPVALSITAIPPYDARGSAITVGLRLPGSVIEGAVPRSRD